MRLLLVLVSAFHVPLAVAAGWSYDGDHQRTGVTLHLGSEDPTTAARLLPLKGFLTVGKKTLEISNGACKLLNDVIDVAIICNGSAPSPLRHTIFITESSGDSSAKPIPLKCVRGCGANVPERLFYNVESEN